MRSFNIKQDTIMVVGLIVLCVLVACVGSSVSRSISRSILAEEATNSARVWFRHLESMPDEVKNLVEGRGASEKLRKATLTLKYFTRIVRYEIFAPDGRLAYSSGQIKDISLPPLEAAFLAKENKDRLLEMQQAVHLFSSDDVTKPRQYAAVLFPVVEHGKAIGSIIVYLDQSQVIATLKSAFNVIAVITVLLLLSAISIPLVIIGIKIRNRWNAEKHIRFLAHNDPLTGLANRVTFHKELAEALERQERTGDNVAVLFLDLDHFKEVNDRLGHAKGDELLKQFAQRLRHCVREGDIVARLSGDEFAIALVGVASKDFVDQPVSRIADAMLQPFQLDGDSVLCSASIGIAIAPSDATQITTLLKCADLALYRSKEAGRNTWRYFERGMDNALQYRRQVEDELRQALEKNEFEMYFQPQFDMETGVVTGSEALIRWHHPTKGLLDAEAFLSVAEDTGLIVDISKWAIYHACAAAAKWRNPLRVAVNLSAMQFKCQSVSSLILDALETTGLDPSRLEIEIAEAALKTNTEKMLKDLAVLKEKGVSIAMDDFGTGSLSLTYLSDFQFGKIKIDRSFVAELTEKDSVRAIAKTILDLGDRLNISVVAVGVERMDQADIFRQLGCRYVQGYLYGRPLPAGAHATLLEATSGKDPEDPSGSVQTNAA